MKKIGIFILVALTLAGCAGFQSTRDMTPEEIAAKPDAWVCARLRTFGYKGRLPPAWSEASALRGLDGCVMAGVQKRRDEAKAEKRRPLTCRTTSRGVTPPECW